MSQLLMIIWRKYRFPQIEKLNKMVLMSEPAQKCENYAILGKAIL